jgi:hypothetical protein
LSAAQNTAARQLAAGSQLGTLGNTAQTEALTEANAQVNAGTLEQQTQQAEDTANYNQYLQQQAYPFETEGWLANIVEGLGSQSGGTSTGQTTTDTSALSSILGGAAGLGSLILPGKKAGGRIVPHRAVGGGLGGAITPYAATGVFNPTAAQPANTGVGGGTWVPAGPLGAGHSNMPTGLNPSAGGAQQSQTPLQNAQSIAATAKGFQGIGTGIANGFTALAPDSVNDAIQDAGDFARGGVPHRGVGGLVPPGMIRPQTPPRATGLMPPSMVAQHFAGGGLVVGDGGLMRRPHFDDGGDVSNDTTPDQITASATALDPTAPTGLNPGLVLPMSEDSQGDLRFDPNAGVLGSFRSAATLPGDVYAGRADPNSDQGIARATGLAAAMMGGGMPFAEKSALGAAGGDLSGMGLFRKIAHDTTQEGTRKLIPEPLGPLERAARDTKGMSRDEILESEPLWGHSARIADALGTPHSEEFSRLANRLFKTHGMDDYITPEQAKLYMQMERLKYGQDPSTYKKGGFVRPHYGDGGDVSPADQLMADANADAPAQPATGLVPSKTPSPKVAAINDLVFNPNSDAVPLVNPVFQGPTPNATPINTGLSAPASAPMSAPTNVATPPQVADVGNVLPRGLRNNNPGNLVDNSWTQSLPGYTGSDGRFATFDSPQSGNAALDRNLQGYAAKGITTPLQIASRWAPASDSNDPVAYAHFIAKQAGVGVDQPIDMTDPAMRARVGAAISRFENGASPATGLVTGRSASPGAPTGVAPAVAAINNATGLVPPQQQDTSGGPLDSIEHAVTGIGGGGGGLLPRGSLGSFGITDSERASLLAAGLGMMSGTSKNPWVNIGQGGLTGLRAMQENAQNQAKTGLVREQTESAKMNNQILKQKLEWMHDHLSQQQKENQAKADATSSTTASPASITAPTITASPNQTSFNQELLAHQKEAEGAAIIDMPTVQKYHQDQIDRALNVGRVIDARGNIVNAPGYNDAEAATEAAKETAKRSAAAPYELQEVQPTPGGPTQYVPKSQLLNLQKTNPDATPVGIGAGSPPGGGASALAANNPMVAKQPAFIAERQKQIADNENQMLEQFQGRQIARQRLQDISKILETYQTGKFAEQKSELVSTLKSIGIPVPKSATANPAAFEQFMKDTTAGIFDQAKSLGGRILVTELAGLGKSNANPAMQPEANRAIIGQALGLLDYEDQHSRDYFDWKRQNPYAYDPSQFEMDWVSKHPVKSYVESARAETPARGEEIPAAAQRQAGQVYMTPKGKMRWMGNGWSREP